MARSRIRDMSSLLSARLLLVLLGFCLVCGDARGRKLGSSDIGPDGFQSLSWLQRKMLQDQSRPAFEERKDERSEETVVEQKQWESKAEEKNEWVETEIKGEQIKEELRKVENKQWNQEVNKVESEQPKVEVKKSADESKEEPKADEKVHSEAREEKGESKLNVQPSQTKDQKEIKLEDGKEGGQKPQKQISRAEGKKEARNSEEKIDEAKKEDPKLEQEKRDVEATVETKDLAWQEKQVNQDMKEEAKVVNDGKGAEEEVFLTVSKESKAEEKKDEFIQEARQAEPVETRTEEDATFEAIADVMDPDDDYPDFVDELRNFPERFQKTAEIVKDHMKGHISGLNKYLPQSKVLFNQASQQIEESFTPLIGKEYAPFIAYVVSYGLLLLPLFLVMFVFDRIRAIFSLQKILLFVNIYLAAYFATLLAATFILGTDPMEFFWKHSTSSYVFLQLVQVFGYLTYLLLQTIDLISTCSSGGFPAKFSAILQWIVVVVVGFHYYVTVFHRAMARRAPLTTWKIYGLYSLSFFFLCFFARIERGKKQYTPLQEDDATDKKN